jgi:pyruvate,water dikinase
MGDEPPNFLVGAEALVEEAQGTRMQGVGVSPGVVTGAVRILRSPSEAARLNAGEILVARATDPGWTPLFMKAGGVIMELGGMLSHGAVVAREYELPAVVNIPGATAALVDGQVVTMDGRQGVVWVSPEKDPAAS